MRSRFILMAAAVLLVMGTAAAQTVPLEASANKFYSWLPIILIGIFASVMITLVMYIAATLINNSRLKQMAIGEFSNVLGTVLVIAIIISAMSLFGSAIYQSDPTLHLDLTQICSQLGSSPLELTNTGINGPTKDVCSGIIGTSSASSTDITKNIDYSLASVYVIVANATTQGAANLNALNVFEDYYATLAGPGGAFTVSENVCWPQSCIGNPAVAPAGPAAGNATYSYMPFNMYGKIRGGTLLLGTEAQIVTYMSILEMIIIIIMLFGWPYLLAAGIALRSLFITRRAGGLMIAIVIVGMFLFPMLNVFEYTALTNANNPLMPIGLPQNAFSAYNSLMLKGQAPCEGAGLSNCTKCIGFVCAFNNNPVITYGAGIFNIYVYPKLDYVLNYDGCWPPGGSVYLGEAEAVGPYVVPVVGQILAIKDFLSTLPTFGGIPYPRAPGLGFRCVPGNVIQSIFDASDFYGMVFVASVLMNVLNMLILLSAVKGISTLLGGDTSLLGLGRLL